MMHSHKTMDELCYPVISFDMKEQGAESGA
jgi:hypothetical protein